MTGVLDARHRAMLEEMCVRVWLPKATPGPGPSSAALLAPVAAPASGDPIVVRAPERPMADAPRAATTALPPAAPAPAADPGRGSRGMPAVVDPSALDWTDLQAAVADCEACGLCRTRRNTVFGVGDRQARWLVVGEAPGEHEDLEGEPFVGTAGQLLDNMLRALGLSRTATGEQAVYIANVLKCRPPSNRNPQPDEVLQCEPYLRRQVALLRPRIILALGRFAAQSLLQGSVPDVAQMPLGKLRGQVHRYEGVPVIVSYHPAYLLRTPQDKAKAWADLCLARATEQSTA